MCAEGRWNKNNNKNGETDGNKVHMLVQLLQEVCSCAVPRIWTNNELCEYGSKNSTM